MAIDELYQQERYADFVREAEEDRKVQAAIQATGRKPFYKPLLSVVGAKLVDVGNRLQDNVETVTPTSLVSASKRA